MAAAERLALQRVKLSTASAEVRFLSSVGRKLLLLMRMCLAKQFFLFFFDAVIYSITVRRITVLNDPDGMLSGAASPPPGRPEPIPAILPCVTTFPGCVLWGSGGLDEYTFDDVTPQSLSFWLWSAIFKRGGAGGGSLISNVSRDTTLPTRYL